MHCIPHRPDLSCIRFLIIITIIIILERNFLVWLSGSSVILSFDWFYLLSTFFYLSVKTFLFIH